MREILFRGKRIDTGEWAVARSFLSMEDTSLGCWLSSKSVSDCTADKNGNLIGVRAIEGAYHIFCKVDPRTLGQYIGLKDKNGNLIFEGDIAFYGDDRVVIEWDNDSALFYTRGLDGSNWITTFAQSYGSDLEVIGNIHDNPELLKEG